MDNIVIETPAEPTEEATVSEEVDSETTAEEGEEEESEETEEEAAPEEEKRKLTAQERIQQLIEQRNIERAEFEKRFAEIEQKVTQPAQPAPDFIEVTPQVEAQVNAALAEYDRLRVEAELDGDYLKSVKYKEQFDLILQGLAENHKRQAAAKEIAEQNSQTEQLIKERAYNAEILRQHIGVPQDDWRRAGEWFTNEATKNPTIGIQFQEIEKRQGTMAAISYAYSVVIQKMGKETQAAVEKKEKKPVSLTATRTVPSTELRDGLDTDEWMRRRKKQLQRTG